MIDVVSNEFAGNLAFVGLSIAIWAHLSIWWSRQWSAHAPHAFGLAAGATAIGSILLAVPVGPGILIDVRHAPLALSPNGWPGLWYDTGPLEPGIDLMVIDGPPWTVHPFTRGAAEHLFGLLSPGGIVLLDDAARPGERLVGRQWKKLHPEMDFELWKGGTKGTLIGRKRHA